MAHNVDGVELRTLSDATIQSVLRSNIYKDTQPADVAVPESEITPAEWSHSTPEVILKSHLQFGALCGSLFLAGWNDASVGPLLPRIQEVYKVNFAVVSLIFIMACIGFIGGAVLNVHLSTKMAFGKILVLGSVLQMIAYTLQAPALPFPVFVLSFTINGVGVAVQDAQANGYVATLKNSPTTKMGLLHTAYGLGAFAAPLVAKQFGQMRQWSFYYLVSLGLATLNTITLSAIFRLKSYNACRAEIAHEPVEESNEGKNAYREIFSLKAVHWLAVMVFVYVGIEVTIGGWIVTYVINLRNGGPDSAYISSGFFGGLTVGRAILIPISSWVGEERAFYLYSLIAVGLELIVWLVPSLIGGGVAVSLVGVVLGPMYPIAMNVASRVIPHRLITGSVGWIAGFGQAGSAAFPFITGAMANSVGISSLQPLLVAMMGLLVVLWFLVPKKRRMD